MPSFVKLTRLNHLCMRSFVKLTRLNHLCMRSFLICQVNKAQPFMHALICQVNKAQSFMHALICQVKAQRTSLAPLLHAACVHLPCTSSSCYLCALPLHLFFMLLVYTSLAPLLHAACVHLPCTSSSCFLCTGRAPKPALIPSPRLRSQRCLARSRASRDVPRTCVLHLIF